MATKLNVREKQALEGAGWIVTDKGVSVTRHNVRYWNPRKDEGGNALGWTDPLPGDGPRMARYFAKGFKLVDPEGNSYSIGRITQTERPIPEKPILEHIKPNGNGNHSIICPLCDKTFDEKNLLISHMGLHKSKKPRKVHKRKKQRRLDHVS